MATRNSSSSDHISCASMINHITSFKLCLPLLKLFLKMESPSSHIAKSLSLLEEQAEEYQSAIDGAAATPLKDHILSLKFGLRFLETFLNLSTNEDLDLRIERVLYDVRLELHSLSNRSIIDGSLILELARAYTNLREKMKNVVFIKPEFGEYDAIFPKLSNYLYSEARLKRINDFLLQISGDLSSCKADLIAPLAKEIEDIKKKLLLVQPLLTYLVSRLVYIPEENMELLTPLVDFLEKAACLLYFCSVDKMDEQMSLAMKRKLSGLVEKTNVKEMYIMTLTASKSYASRSMFNLLYILINLLDCNGSSAKYLNDPSKKLHDELNFTVTLIEDLPNDLALAKFNYLAKAIEAITWKSIPVVYSCHDRDMKEDMAREVNDALSEVLDQTKHIQEDVKEIKLYNYPKTDGLGSLDLFLVHLEELFKFQPELIKHLKNQVETLHQEFDFFRSFFRKIKGQQYEHEEMGDLWLHIIGLVHQAEYVIDFYLVEKTLDSRIILSLSKIIEQTKVIRSEVKRIYDEEKYHNHAHHDHVAKISSRFSSQATDRKTDGVVGFEDVTEKMMEYIVGDQRQLDFVSIVGMAGLGKTTLAKKMYEAPSIVEHFDIRAWCTVSQTYQKRELLLTILGSVIRVTTRETKLNDGDLAAKLYQSLKGRRYLIVIDDIWDIRAWNGMRRSFPDDNNHSRILITTRLQNVASRIKEGSKVHSLRQLSDVESWELFQKTLCKKESLSKDFLEVGKQIAQSCKGLPLAIVVIAGLLAKVEKSVPEWEKVAGSLSSHIFSDSQSQCMAIMELSYVHLPDHLKSCFLYFGAFAEDEEIPVQKLKQLWIAEGFVRNNEPENLEDVAEEYFKDLISRSLVIATKERTLEGVKACRVHDLLREFCLEKVKEESFLLLVHADHFSKFSEVYDQRRLIIHSKASDLAVAKPCGPCVRSLLHTPIASRYGSSDISFISKNFRLLTVLDLAYIYIGESYSGIELLIHLRYLAVQADPWIPSSISNLWNLQYFLINTNQSSGFFGTQLVPDSIWDMVKLRHVDIRPQADFSVYFTRFLKSALLYNLESFSTPILSYGGYQDQILKRLPKLQKLRCVYRESMDVSTGLWRFPELDFLSQLVSLTVIVNGNHYWRQRCELKLPSNLQKLNLLACQLMWEDISEIGRALPSLKVLKLDGNSLFWLNSMEDDKNHDAKWNVDDGDFPELKYLKLSGLSSFGEWIASDDSFPKLEQLVLDNCKNLKEIPSSCFGGRNTLRMITVRNCTTSVKDSVKSIQMEHQEMGNEDFRVYLS